MIIKCNDSITNQPVVSSFLFISLSETYDKFDISLAMSTSNPNDSIQNTVQRPSRSHNTVQRPSTSSTSDSPRSKSPARQPSRWKIELKKQRQLMTGISIDGLPIQDGEDVRALFLQLCQHINFKISHKGLNDVHRDTNKSIVVDLKTIGLKRNMFRAWRQALSSSSTFFGRELSSRARSGRISIHDAKTPYYAMLYKVARNAVDDRILENCEICIHGLEITCDHGRKKAVVLSLSELDDLINRYSRR